jgi:hypothetical protein
MQPVAESLTKLLGKPVKLIKDWLDGVEVAPGVLFENVRFNKGEGQRRFSQENGRSVRHLRHGRFSVPRSVLKPQLTVSANLRPWRVQACC